MQLTMTFRHMEQSDALKAYAEEKLDTVQTEQHNMLDILERSILQILLLYGNLETDFVNVYVKFDDNQQEVETSEKVRTRVYERIYLNLQEDEVEFSNPTFKLLYDNIMEVFLKNEALDNNKFLNTDNPEITKVVTDLLMDDEKYKLHGWQEKKNVYVKDKTDEEILCRLVSENIIAFREHLIKKLNTDLMLSVSEGTQDVQEAMELINDYNKLKVFITRTIGRMRSY